MKEYTVVTFKRDKDSNKVYSLSYYWNGAIRKCDKIEILYNFFYSKPEILWDDNLFSKGEESINVFGDKVVKIIPKNSLNYDDFKKIQTVLKGFVFETDVKSIDRWLWEEKPKFSRNIRKWYIDIEILRDTNGQYCSPNDATNKIASITFYDSFNKKYYVLLLTDKKEQLKKDDRYVYTFNDESIMLDAFLKSVDQLQPDYFTGWNVTGFDIPYLVKRMEVLGIDNRRLSPVWSVNLKMKTFKNNINFETTIKGRGIIDLMEISKQFWLGTDVGYSLEMQSQKWLGEGKIKIGDIDKAYKNDFWKFVEYNVKDVELCIKLDEKKRLIADMQEFQDIISINLYDTPIAGRIINYYFKQNTDIILDDSYGKEDFELPGGYVHPVSKGIFKNVNKFDFASHYPAIIRSYNISNDTIVYNPIEEMKKDLIHFSCYYRYVEEKGTKGYQIVLDSDKKKGDEIFFEVWFKKEPRGCITKAVDTLTIERLKMKRSGMKSRSTVLKRMLNSYFGQFGYKYSRFFNKDCAISITLIGQYLTKTIINTIQNDKKGWVLLADTDSFAVDLYDNSTKIDIFSIALEVFNKTKIEHNLDKIYSELELEAVIDKMILFGVKKKYAQDIKKEIKIQGLEMIRKDFPEALKDFQRKMIKCIFDNDNPNIKDLKNIRQEIEAKIRESINKKDYMYIAMPTVIKKPITEYTSNTMEKKALNNSGLKISINEMFYILHCQSNKDIAFKNIEELDKIQFKVDYDVIIEKIFGNIGIFEDLFIKQQTLLSFGG